MPGEPRTGRISPPVPIFSLCSPHSWTRAHLLLSMVDHFASGCAGRRGRAAAVTLSSNAPRASNVGTIHNSTGTTCMYNQPQSTAIFHSTKNHGIPCTAGLHTHVRSYVAILPVNAYFGVVVASNNTPSAAREEGWTDPASKSSSAIQRDIGFRLWTATGGDTNAIAVPISRQRMPKTRCYKRMF